MASQFSTYTKEALLKKLKKQKAMVIIQSVVIVLMIVLAVFSTIEKGVSYQTFIFLFFIPMLFVMIFEVKKINQELKKRS